MGHSCACWFFVSGYVFASGISGSLDKFPANVLGCHDSAHEVSCVIKMSPIPVPSAAPLQMGDDLHKLGLLSPRLSLGSLCLSSFPTT